MKPVINLTDKASLNSEQDANSKSRTKKPSLINTFMFADAAEPSLVKTEFQLIAWRWKYK